MNESKSVLTDRLRRENRWDKASQFKDEKIREFKQAGMKRQEASQKAWQAMAEQFPPLPVEAEAAGCAPLEATADELAALPTDTSMRQLAADAAWAYSRLCSSDVRASDAPSAGAWSLLCWARQNESDFFKQILPKAVTLSERYAEHDLQQEGASGEEQAIRDIEEELHKLRLKDDPMAAMAAASYEIVDALASSGQATEEVLTAARSIVKKVEQAREAGARIGSSKPQTGSNRTFADSQSDADCRFAAEIA